MRPKDYFDKNPAQEDDKYVFCLFPDALKERYKKSIKAPITSSELQNGRALKCESYLDFKAGTSVMEGIWKGIQKAGLVVADITNLNPNVMYELGVALMKKDNVLIVAEEGMGGQKDLPFDLAHLTVSFYSTKDENLEDIVMSFVQEKLEATIDSPTFLNPAETKKLLQQAKFNAQEGQTDVVDMIFEKIVNQEPGNWYIHLEWGKALNSHAPQKAEENLLKALSLASTKRQKAQIYLELAEFYRKIKKLTEALTAYEESANLNDREPKLYVGWADLFGHMGDFEQASTKIKVAMKLVENSLHGELLMYYTKRFADPSYKKSFKEFKRTELDSTPEIKSPSFKDWTKAHPPKSTVEGKITAIKNFGIFVQLTSRITGLLHISQLPASFEDDPQFRKGKKLKVLIDFIKYKDEKIDLKLA